MESTIAKLKGILDAEDFILTGSYVLATYGLRKMEDVRDLDIILIKPKPSTIELINKFMKEFPAKTIPNPLPVPEEIKETKRTSNYDDEEEIKPAPKKQMVAKVQPAQLMAIFMYDNIKIDIYILPSFSEPTLVINGYKHTTIPHIIQAKKSYGRMKDWLQCRDMARIFFKSEEFQNAIDGDWKGMLRTEY